MYAVVFVTAGSRKEAGSIAAGLIRDKLAACVNIVDKADSVFFWDGKVRKSRESILMIKTRRSKLDKLIRRVKSLHSYTVPEIIALPVLDGYKPYLRWVDESVR
jgi:periplasmic divalent cation tolerance protein